MMRIRLRFFLSLLVILLSVWLANILRIAWGWSPEIAFVSILVPLFFLDIWEYLPLVLAGTWFFIWPWQLGLEGPLTTLILLVFFLGARILPIRPWFSTLILSVLGICILVLMFAPGFFLASWNLLLLDLLLSAAYGQLLFFAYEHLAGYHVRTLGPVPQHLPIYFP